jgi:hypothetical protein
MVQVHELGCEGISRSYVFRGTKDYTAKQVFKQRFGSSWIRIDLTLLEGSIVGMRIRIFEQGN